MGLANIVNGHLNELLGSNADIARARMRICKECPIRKDSFLGYLCSSKLWLNPKTGDVSTEEKDGYKCGCGCRLSAKVRDLDSVCPAGKW